MDYFNLEIEIDKDDCDAAEIFVKASADGNNFRFLLDSGSSKTILARDEITKKYDSSDKHRLAGLMGILECDLITVDEFNFGPVTKSNFQICRMPVDGPSRSQIGMDLLADKTIHFKFDENRAYLGNIDFKNPQPLLLDSKNIPYIDMEINTHTTRCFWDTGAGITVVDKNFLDQNSKCFKSLGELGIDDTTETEKINMPLYLVSGLKIGKFVLPDHKVVVVDLSPINEKVDNPVNFILGYTTLAKANWLFDFPNKKWEISTLI